MKKIILVSMFVIASIAQFSCTDDTAGTNSSTDKVNVVTDEAGDPNNPTTPQRPK